MQTYRARSSQIWGWTAVGTGAVIAVWHVIAAGLGNAQGGLGVGAGMIALGLAAFLRPHVAVTDDRVEIHNITQVATVPFSRLEGLDTRWSLEVRGDDGRKAGAFAAPAPGAAQSRRIEKQVARESESGVPPLAGRAGDATGTPSGDASAMIRARWDAWRAAHPSGDPAGEGPSVLRRIDPVGLGLAIGGLAAAAWGLLL
ncbi:hypothetical protein QQX10_07360 [Demequina sp. SYSU T00039]|uniref:PH domain-containing protein n=1 Tax=Demequina lignilytica TaxID=3051663 RepID=A0AAW7M7Y2_9MICO|nr:MULTISPECIES: hypothetical protein [unclassified Demequina]MDN4477666.1 hypothetical protein [Demequina sp. SYSU T00039-1]MDN4487983.1 hypothetical protein [Demequina sp. SYSU T00039]MDN4490423.1 hypothetical protein [Demequina sp. SYSU T00068]